MSQILNPNIINALKYELKVRRCTTPIELSEKEAEEILHELKKEFNNVKISRTWLGEVVFYR